jgi:UrcA family protein
MSNLTSIRENILGRILPVAFAAGAIALVSARAHAAETNGLNPIQLDPITVSAPTVKVIGRDAASGAPDEEVMVTARVEADPAALRTEYGALMLKYSVFDAARKACSEPDPIADDNGDGTCVYDAVKAAEPQVDAAITRARSSAAG